MKRTLNPFEQWMVKSNLQTIASGASAEEIVATVKGNGYADVAAAIESELQNQKASVQ